MPEMSMDKSARRLLARSLQRIMVGEVSMIDAGQVFARLKDRYHTASDLMANLPGIWGMVNEMMKVADEQQLEDLGRQIQHVDQVADAISLVRDSLTALLKKATRRVTTVDELWTQVNWLADEFGSRASLIVPDRAKREADDGDGRLKLVCYSKPIVLDIRPAHPSCGFRFLKLGRFKIVVPLTSEILANWDGAVRVIAISPNTSVSGHCHPHIRAGTVCTNTDRAMLQNYFRTGKIAAAMGHLMDVLNAYQPDNAYSKADLWFGKVAACPGCSMKKRHGRPPVCRTCGASGCKACYVKCYACSYYCCRRCRVPGNPVHPRAEMICPKCCAGKFQPPAEVAHGKERIAWEKARRTAALAAAAAEEKTIDAGA